MSVMVSGDKAAAGIWRAFVIQEVLDDPASRYYVYIPQLHRKNFPFESSGEEMTVRGDITLTDYPMATAACWAVRSSLKTGDAVWLVFENGDINYPVILGQFATCVPTYEEAAAMYSSASAAASNEMGLSNLGTPVEVLTPPEGLGTVYTYEAWNRKEQGFKYDWNKSSAQYKLFYNYSHTFDSNGFGKIGNRYVIAMTSNHFAVGDVVDVAMSNGRTIAAIIGDCKNPGDAGAAEWGHQGGKCMVEWMTNWKSGHANPPSDGSVVTIYKYGSFFDHPEWATASLSASSSDSEVAGDSQQKVATVAKDSSKYGIAATSGACQAWVADVYQKALGGSRNSKGTAAEAARTWSVSSNFQNIQPGATVYGLSSKNANGYKKHQGHVGIYVGNGEVYHNVGHVAHCSLNSWISTYNGKCWGWNGVVLNSAYPINPNVGKTTMIWP